MLASSASSQFFFFFFCTENFEDVLLAGLSWTRQFFEKCFSHWSVKKEKKRKQHFRKKGCHTESNFAERQTLMAEHSPPSCQGSSEHFFTATFASSTICTFVRPTWKCQSQLESGNVEARRSSSVVSCPRAWRGLLPTHVTLESGGRFVRVSRLWVSFSLFCSSRFQSLLTFRGQRQ